MKYGRSYLNAFTVLAALSAAGCGKGTDAAEPETAGAAVAAPAASTPGGTALPSCGTKGAPDCPLQAWMKGNVASRMSSGDSAGLAGAFRRIAAFEPAGYEGWVTMSVAGEKAAIAGDLDGVRQSCKGCHERHRESYRANLRARPLPPDGTR